MTILQGPIEGRSDDVAGWTAADPVLLLGELGFESDTGRFKIGDGLTAWSSLAYATSGIIVPDDLTATGTPSSSTYLRGDGTWASPAGGGGGDLLAANNLSDVVSASAALANLNGLSVVAVPGDITATGTADATTFLRGDGSWQAPAGTGLDPALNLSDVANVATARTNLGLDTLATQATVTVPFEKVAGLSGAIATDTGTSRIYFKRAATITNVMLSVGVTSSSGSVTIDVNKNGTSIYPSAAKPTIAAGSFVDLTSVPDTTAVSAGDYLTIDIDAAGTGAEDLTAQIEYTEDVA